MLQTDNDAFTPPLVFYRPDALSAAQPTASKLWRQVLNQDLKGNFFYYIWSEVLTGPPTQSAVKLKALLPTREKHRLDLVISELSICFSD